MSHVRLIDVLVTVIILGTLGFLAVTVFNMNVVLNRVDSGLFEMTAAGSHQGDPSFEALAKIATPSKAFSMNDVSPQQFDPFQNLQGPNLPKPGDLSMTGRWRLIANTASPVIPTEINAARIVCRPGENICSETAAYLDVSSGTPLLNMLPIDYDIREVTEANLIRAVHSGPTADIELRISIADESAERSFREKAGGSDASEGDVFAVWLLE